MKNVLKVTALSLGLVFASGNAIAEENIAFINAGYLFQNHPDREAVAKKLSEDAKPQADKLAASKKSIDGKMEALQKEAPKLRKGDIEKREAEINKLMQAHNENLRKFEVEAEQREVEARTKLLENIQFAAAKVAKDKKFTYVLDSNAIVFVADENTKDITEDVLNEIKSSKK